MPGQKRTKGEPRTALNELPQSARNNLDRVVILRSRGKTNEDIARTLHIEMHSLIDLLRTPEFNSAYAELQQKKVASAIEKEAELAGKSAAKDEARKVLDAASIKAACYLAQIAENEDTPTKLRIAANQDILDRCGLKGNIVTEIINRNYTPEEIESAKQTLLEIEAISARVTTARSRFVLTSQEQSPSGGVENSVKDEQSTPS